MRFRRCFCLGRENNVRLVATRIRRSTIMKNLDDVRRRLKYLSLPVREVSRLHRNGSERYETDSGHYYTSGSPIEALVQEGYRDVPYWVWTYVEHNCRDYYLVGYGDLNIEDLTVRVRGEG